MAGRGPGGFLQNLKAKVTEAFKEFQEPADPYETKLSDHVERATSELLVGPDWGLNFELVDSINNDPQGSCDKVYRAMRQCLLKPNIHTQLLTLSLLEACVKNCVPFFYQQLMYSDLWGEILKAGEPFRNWDAEVRDKALGLIEDFAHGLPHPAYKEAYESLVDCGVDFPVRPQAAAEAAGGAPYYTPPAMPASEAAAGQGISPEDRAAIAAAVADLEAQAAQQDVHDAALAPPGMPAAGHVPAAMGPAVLMGAPIRPPGYQPPLGYHPPHVAAAQPAMVAAASPHQLQHGSRAGSQAGAASGMTTGVPSSRQDVEQTLRVSRNSCELLGEMLGPIKAGGDVAGLQESFVKDLVDQCYRYKSMLAELIPSLTQEELVVAALAANDDLARVLHEYDSLAKGVAPGTTAAAAPTAAAPSSSSSAGGATSSQAMPSTFTLLGDDEDDEGQDLSLATRRGAGTPVIPSPAAGVAAATTPAKADDLISFDAAPAAGSSTAGSTAAAAAAAAAAPSEQQLAAQLDELLLSGQPPAAKPQ